MIYFLGTRSDSGMPLIKIGFSKTEQSLESRLSSVRTGCPFPARVEFTMEGDMVLEQTLHHIFARYRYHGEWFRWVHPIRAFIVMVKRDGLDHALDYAWETRLE